MIVTFLISTLEKSPRESIRQKATTSHQSPLPVRGQGAVDGRRKRTRSVTVTTVPDPRTKPGSARDSPRRLAMTRGVPYPPEVRAKAVELYVSGLSIERVEKVLGGPTIRS